MRVKLKPLKTSISASVCNHRHDAVATFTHQTDTRVETSIYAAEMFGFKNNVRLGAYISNKDGLTTGIFEQEQTGVIRNDNYFPTDYWKNPTTGNIEIIPNYYSTTWGQAGVDAFENAVLGASKATRTPKHGQQMYNITNGRLGFDLITNTIGSSGLSELNGLIQDQKDWLFSNTGRYVSSGSYKNGDTSSRYNQVPYYLGFRNSQPDANLTADANTYYGLDSAGNPMGFPYYTTWDRDRFIDFPSSSRWWDSWNTRGFTKEESTTYYTTQLTKCIIENGWYKDFCHWHSARNNGTITSINEFLEIFNTTKGINFVWTCSMGEAFEYLFLRSMVDYVNVIEFNGKLSVVIEVLDEFKDTFKRNINQTTPLDTINIPLSVKVDLTGTILEGRDITSSYGKIINKSDNIFILEIPFNHKDGFGVIELNEGDNGYYDTNIPTATITTSSGKLTVSANQPCKMVLFSVASGGNYYDGLPVQRIDEFKDINTFNITSGFDYKVGVINEFGYCNLI